MPRRKNTADTARVGVREAVRAKFKRRADRWGHIPDAPYRRILEQLDAGEDVLVTYKDLHGTGAIATRGGRYVLHADGTLTEDHYIDRPGTAPARN
ncbi:hypothetical protein BIU98_16760 [Curtobacterium sp. MMLR14_010]|uniref:hypothetical protein n=1 Tax=Curtobacterium sp. MMLR14_010 TaxID=1898743 RepID=UPI0008DE3E21|nr:hypothetical protein [Curtobacterium sp. MMLR14_010]OII37104.1 hypothetical protein BIU98_16760 [Curtobacterium sp. MMLR14_010]